MSQPLFLLQIVRNDENATVARIPGGGKLEADLVDIFVSNIMSRGVGFKSSSHVEQDIRAGITDAIYSMKAQTVNVTK